MRSRREGAQLEVTYSFRGNGSDGLPSHFSLAINSGGDINLVADTVALSGGTTTMVYPNTSTGDTTYHVEVQASGRWSVTVTKVS